MSASQGPRRFLREITTTANLRHPSILPLYDSGEADGSLYYVSTIDRSADDLVTLAFLHVPPPGHDPIRASSR